MAPVVPEMVPKPTLSDMGLLTVMAGALVLGAPLFIRPAGRGARSRKAPEPGDAAQR